MNRLWKATLVILMMGIVGPLPAKDPKPTPPNTAESVLRRDLDLPLLADAMGIFLWTGNTDQHAAAALEPMALSILWVPVLLEGKSLQPPPTAPEPKRWNFFRRPQVTPEISAIRFLATLDCELYPEMVDNLLASLDHESEVIRQETLQALRRVLFARKGGEVTRNAKKRVVDRLADYLLTINDAGRLWERHAANRSAAIALINDCLSTPPAEE